jgi:hypothetical protein
VEPADHLAITMLAARYARGVDRRDAAALTALFTPDAVVVLPPELNGAAAPSEVTGSEAISTSVLHSVSRFVLTRHVVEQHVAEMLSDDRAQGETYCTAHHIARRDDAHRDARVAIRYHDTYARTGGIWRFSRRQLVVDFIEQVPVTLPHRTDHP